MPLHLRLITTTLAHLEAEDSSGEALSRLLGLSPPPEWPPENNDAATRSWLRARLLATPADTAWGGFYVCVDDTHLVGSAGFHGPPHEGVVELGYSIIPSWQHRGLGTRAAKALCELAFAEPRVTAIKAQTLPRLLFSQRVLTRCGFAFEGAHEDPAEGTVWSYRLSRAQYQAHAP